MKERKIRKDRVYILIITFIAFTSLSANVIQNELYKQATKQYKEEYSALINEYEEVMFQAQSTRMQTTYIND